jgi:anaerobic magnesium-protoporphyrin IX monomethyl ester cyclase
VAPVPPAVGLCRSVGIQTGMFLMWGYEGEDLSDIEATVEHVKKTDPDIFFTTVAYPIKGTPYFFDVAERVENAKPWGESSDREFKVRNRHSRQFYRFADKLLRSEVELRRLGLKPDANDASLAELRSGIAEARAGLQATVSEVEV